MLEDLATPKLKLSPCKVRTVAETLDAKDRKILLAAVINPEWPIVTLSEALRAKGIELSASPLTKHRKGNCSCSKI